MGSVWAFGQEDTVRIQGSVSPEQQAELDYNNGIEALKRKDFNTAAGLFTQCLAVKPGFDKALANRAIAYTNLRKYNEALNDINLAISSNPENPDNYFNKSLIYARQSKKDSQHVALDQCLRLDGTHAEASYYKGLLSFEDRDFDKAAGYYSIAISTNPDHAFAFNDRGSAKREKGDFAGAIEDYKKALEIDNKMVFVWNNLGSAYRNNKEHDKAIEAYSKSLELDPKYVMALINRGTVYFEKEDLKVAQKNFEDALNIDPNNAHAYNNLASIAIKQQDFKKAKDLTARAIGIDAKLGAAYYNRGVARQMLREEEGCCADWKKAYQLGISAAKSYYSSTCSE
jgi:tetratricopeptide (TPR) repeat protein